MGKENAVTVTIYTKPGCPYCAAAKDDLLQRGVDYDEVDVYATPGAREKVTELTGGQRVVPGAGMSMDQIVTMGGVDLDLGQPWVGDAELQLFDSPWDEPASLLPVDEIIAGYFCEVGTTFNGGTLLTDRSQSI